MKIKTSIALSEELLKAIDQQSEQFKNRFDFIETALRVFISQMICNKENINDLEIINDRADYLIKKHRMSLNIR